MKGIVFNLLEDVITREHGAGTWDALLDAAGLEGAYTSLGSYPDAQIQKLVSAAAALLGLHAAEVLRWFGQRAIPILAQRHPAFFGAHESTLPFLLSLNSIIHPEVRKIYPGADVPTFDFRQEPDGALIMGYDSRRKFCALVQGFAEGTAAHYGENMRFEHLACMHKGDPKCVFRIELSPGRGST